MAISPDDFVSLVTSELQIAFGKLILENHASGATPAPVESPFVSDNILPCPFLFERDRPSVLYTVHDLIADDRQELEAMAATASCDEQRLIVLWMIVDQEVAVGSVGVVTDACKGKRTFGN